MEISGSGGFKTTASDCRQSPRHPSWIFLSIKGLKVSIYKTFRLFFGIMEVSNTGGDYSHDDSGKRKSKKTNADCLYR